MNHYIELLTSLPHLHDPFRVQRPPISAVQLRKRFAMLEPDDQHLMQQLWESVLWSSIPLQTEDVTLVARWQRLLRVIEDPVLLQWLHWRINVRIVLSALRQRLAGQEAPARSAEWAVGQLPLLLRRNWQQPAFGLQSRMPWLTEAEQLLQSGESLLLERLVLQQVWQYYERCLPQPPYGFTAVFLYVSRWDICQRWTSYDHQAGLVRFDQLVSESMQAGAVNLEEWN